MKRILILGAGTAGTILANKLQRALPPQWHTTVVDPGEVHLYQPGLLFLPFGSHDERRITRSRQQTLRPSVEWLRADVSSIDPHTRSVRFLEGGSLNYDFLVIASGARPRPDLVPGMIGEDERQDVFDFFTLGGAQALRDRLSSFREGRLVVTTVDNEKSPLAALEFIFLADAFLRARGDRHRVDLAYVTPLPAATVGDTAAHALEHLLDRRGIHVETGFVCRELDRERRAMVGDATRRVGYDLLVAIPPHGGAAFVDRSELAANKLGFIPVDPQTLAARDVPRVFVVGDAADIPTAKMGSAAAFQAHLLADNLVRLARGQDVLPTYNGRATYVVEVGSGEALTVDLDYENEAQFGHIGPVPLLDESRLAHFGKRAFRWLYWNMLLAGRRVPVPGRRPSAPPPILG